MTKTKTVLLSLASLSLIATGCGKKKPKPSDTKPVSQAKSEAPKNAPTSTAPAPVGTSIKSNKAAGDYAIDPVHTQIIFQIGHAGASLQYGMLRGELKGKPAVSGSFKLDDDASKSMVAFEIDAASVFTANKKRDDHIKSPDFLDAGQFPKIAFKSKSVEATGPNTYDISGDLTLHGVTKPVTITAKHIGAAQLPQAMGGKFITGFNAEFGINRMDYGVKGMAGVLTDEIKFMIAIEGARK